MKFFVTVFLLRTLGRRFYPQCLQDADDVFHEVEREVSGAGFGVQHRVRRAAQREGNGGRGRGSLGPAPLQRGPLFSCAQASLPLIPLRVAPQPGASPASPATGSCAPAGSRVFGEHTRPVSKCPAVCPARRPSRRRLWSGPRFSSCSLESPRLCPSPAGVWSQISRKAPFLNRRAERGFHGAGPFHLGPPRVDFRHV